MVAKVLGKTVVIIKAHSKMYKMLVRAVLLYGREIWVVTDVMMTVLEGFHHKTARRIAEMTSRRGNSGEC